LKNGKTQPVYKPKLFYGWYLVAIAWLMLFLAGSSATSLFFKPILDEFGWERASLSLIGAICMLITAVLLPFLGRLVDHFGPRVMVFSTLVLQILSNTIYGVASNIVAVFFGRLLVEFRPSTPTTVLINRWFVKARGRALGILSTSTPLGALVLSPLSQYLINTWGWRNTLFFWAAVTLVAILPVSLLIRDKPEDKGLAPDGVPIDDSRSPDLQSPLNATKSGIGSSLKQTFGNPSFWFLASTQFICGIGCGLWMTHTVIFATDLGYSSMIGASFLSVQGGMSLVGVLLTGHLSDFIPRNKVLGAAHFIRGISFFVIVAALLFAGGSLWMLYLAMVLFGFGWFTTAPLTGGLVADLFGNQRMGTITGIITGGHFIGAALGTFGGGFVYTLTGSYFEFFVAQGILEMVAMGLAFAIIKKKRYIASKSN
jgi:sugar phosphate permease